MPTVSSSVNSAGNKYTSRGGAVAGTPVPREEFESHKSFTFWFMGGVLVFVVGTFLIEVNSMHRNYAQDKALALQNNQLNKDYFEKVLQLQNQIHEQKSELELLKARNVFLK